MKIKFLFLVLLFCSAAFSQTKGTVSGTLTDKDLNNEPLAFANAIIKGTTIGVTTDDAGKYSLQIEPGTYVIQFSFLGYETIEEPVTVVAGETVTVNKSLGAGSYTLQDVMVQQAASREKETALLLDQKNAVEIKQSIGAQEMSRKGVSDVEEGLTKITGITKVGSRGLFVRGLEDRYNNLLVNDLAVPSNNPFKKIIPLDLFPTDIVSIIEVYKTFSPNLYGDFAGGTFDILTSKGAKSVTKINIGVGYTTNNNMEDFLLSEDVNTTKGFFGMTGKDREMPGIFGDTPSNPTLTGEQSLKAFDTGFNVDNTKSPLNTSIGVLHSERFTLENERKLSYLLSINFDNNYSFRKGVERSVEGSETLISYKNDFMTSEYRYKTNVSALVGLNYKTKRWDLGFSTFYLRTTESSIKDQLGSTVNNAPNNNYLIRTNQLDQSDYITAQLNGEYALTEDKNQTLTGGVSFSKTAFQQPDRKSYGGTKVNDNEILTSYTGNNFLRQYLDIDGNFFVSGLLEYELKFGKEKQNKLTLGYNGNDSMTESTYRFVSVTSDAALPFTTSMSAIDSQINADLANNVFRFRESSNSQYQVKLNEIANAGFVDAFFKFNKWEVSGGVRLESTIRETKYRPSGSFDDPFVKLTYDNLYVLPSVNVKYGVTEKANVRFSAAKTYTRPVIMEAYPIEYINADGTSQKGNPDLVNSDNYNVDVKFELFPTNKEVVAVGLFGKKIENPIERTFQANAASGLITTFLNSEEATLYGAEIEFIVGLERIHKSLEDLSFGFNTSLMYTNVTSDNAQETHPDRELQGASKWIINSDLKYQFNLNKNWSNTVSLVYSVFGKRIYSVGTFPYDHIYELPASKLDFVWSSKLSDHFDLKFSADNLLNPVVKTELGKDFSPEYEESSYTLSDYKRGVGFSLSIGYTF